jgi:DTW domain-containing protein
MIAYRPTCHRCRRPASHCYCAHLTPIASRTHVVFLQHPREHRVPIGTARMTHLGLANSELHIGADLDRHPRVQRLVEEQRIALLFPGPGAVEPEALPEGPPETLVVLDGTWIQAGKMLARSRLLQRLPRVGFTPPKPGAYRIRREPAAHCLATIEAVVQVLGRLEDDPERFTPLLGAFEQMVEQQLHFKTARPNPYFHAPRPRVTEGERLRAMLTQEREHLVVVHGEANAHAMEARVPGDPELLQLVAERIATGERFEALLAARRPLAPSVPLHLELPPARFAEGEPVADALARFAAFLRPEDRLCTWGRFTLDLLRAEGFATPSGINLRDVAARVLALSPGGPDQAAVLLAADRSPRESWTGGRAGRRVAALATIIARVLDPD